MGWWRNLRDRLFGSGRGTSFHVRVELIPGKLTVEVYHFEMDHPGGRLACWSYVTDGLWLPTRRQRELVFTLRRRRDEASASFAHTDLWDWFRSVYAAVEQGHSVEAGSTGDFVCTSGFLGQRSIMGLLYLPLQRLPWMEAVPLALTVLLLTPEELEAVRRFGPYRVTALLGQAAQHYPLPPWSDRDRPTVLARKDIEQSLLARLPCLGAIAGATVRLDEEQAGVGFPVPCIMPNGQQMLHLPRPYVPGSGPPPTIEMGVYAERVLGFALGEQLTLHVPRSSQGQVQQVLGRAGEEAPLALLLEPYPTANARLVWRPGQEGMQIFQSQADEVSCLTGGFLALMPSTEPADRGEIYEDGFALHLGPDSWKSVRTALRSGQDVKIPTQGDFRKFSLEGGPKATPVAEMNYVKGGVDEGVPPAPRGEPVRLTKAFSHYSLARVKQRVNRSELSRYVTALEAALRKYFQARPAFPGMALTLTCALYPGAGARLWAEWQTRGSPGSVTEELLGRLREVPAPALAQGPLSFLLSFSVGAGSGDQAPAFSGLIPEAWLWALVPGKPMSMDEIIHKVWYVAEGPGRPSGR
jgi:hypothetical protein